MSFRPRIDARPLTRGGWRARVAPVVPWIFIVGVAAGVLAANHDWRSWIRLPPLNAGRSAQNADVLWRREGNPDARHAATVLHTIDGDTFEARVAVWPGLNITTRIRLRGIDAPELKAMCADELRRAELATGALDRLLREGGVVVYNVGPDKYEGRVVADVATSRTPNVSAALLAGGYARAYDGGHRERWCMGAGR